MKNGLRIALIIVLLLAGAYIGYSERSTIAGKICHWRHGYM
jgi:hypothetical protein